MGALGEAIEQEGRNPSIDLRRQTRHLSGCSRGEGAAAPHRSTVARVGASCTAVFCIGLSAFASLAHASDTPARTLQDEKIEWTWSDRPEQADPRLPNVLLEGDSITRNYYEPVQLMLKGKANVYLFSTSLSVGDPRLAGEIEGYLTARPLTFAVIHLNNGMHGPQYTAQDFKTYYPELIAPIKRVAPHANCIVATTTPVRTDSAVSPTNMQINQRNIVAVAYAAQYNCALDDQYRLMMQHQDLHSDEVHFSPDGAAIQARQVAVTIETMLSGRAK